jgi:hypothetical protein
VAVLRAKFCKGCGEAVVSFLGEAEVVNARIVG